MPASNRLRHGFSSTEVQRRITSILKPENLRTALQKIRKSVDVTLESASRQTTVIAARVWCPNNLRTGPVAGISTTWYSKARTLRLSPAQRSSRLSLSIPRSTVGGPALRTSSAAVVPTSVVRAFSDCCSPVSENTDNTTSTDVNAATATRALPNLGTRDFRPEYEIREQGVGATAFFDVGESTCASCPKPGLVCRASPNHFSRSAISSCPSILAISRGVWPISFLIVDRAPFSTKSRTASGCCCVTASCKGVSPFSPTTFTSAPPSIRAFSSSMFPRTAAT
jgi:hypothetical protein